MQLKTLKRDKKYIWTNHVLQKMAYYRLSESRVKRILRHPKRVEEGIAPDTVACMQAIKSKKRQEEIWVMYQKRIKNKELRIKNGKQGKTIIISAWRYPGVSPVGKKIEIPQDTLEFLQKQNSKNSI